MKVLIVQPSCIVSERWSERISPFLSLGLGYLAASLRAHGHEVKLLDALTEGWEQRWRLEGGWIEIGLSEEDIASIVRTFRPQVVGFSVPFTVQMPRVRSLAHWVKAIHPEILVVCGGNHPTVSPREVLSIPEVDIVVLGEGEEVFPRLLARLARGQSVKQLNGIAFRDDNGETAINPRLKLVEDLDSLPMPAFDLMPLRKFFRAVGKRSFPMFTSRGCSGSCAGCSTNKLYGTKTRRLSAESLVRQMQHLIEFYGVREFSFDDDTLFSDRQAAYQLVERLISAKMKTQWTAQAGCDSQHLDEELLAKMRESGGKRLHFAPLSGSRRVLYKILDKPIDLFALEQAILRSLKVGFKITCEFMIGLPGETLDEVYETLNFGWKLRSYGVHDFQFSLAVPFPGTKVRSLAEELNTILPYPEPMLTPLDGCISTDKIGAQEIVQVRDTAEREFSSRGIVPVLRLRMPQARKPSRQPVERFFYTVAPQPNLPQIAPAPKTRTHQTAEETA